MPENDSLSKKLGVNSSVEEILIVMEKAINDVPAISPDGNTMNAVKDDTSHRMQYAAGLLNYKGAELNAKATDRLIFATWVLVFVTIVLLLATIVSVCKMYTTPGGG